MEGFAFAPVRGRPASTTTNVEPKKPEWTTADRLNFLHLTATQVTAWPPVVLPEDVRSTCPACLLGEERCVALQP